MNREMIKTFILAVLVALSFLLSYILWSYQPKYEMFYDASYISEVDVGGVERTRNDLIRPTHIMFHQYNAHLGKYDILSFIHPVDEYKFYKEIASWSLTDYNVREISTQNTAPTEEQYIEIVFPSIFSAQLLENVFSLAEMDEIELPTWSFDRAYIVTHDDAELSVRIHSLDNREQMEATVEKAGAFQMIARFNSEHSQLQPFVQMPFGVKPIYVPETVENLTKKTLVANQIDSDSFINTLFSNPSLVKPNQQEAFFTDGQRGLRLFQDGRYLEFIHPIETNDDKLDPAQLFDKSVSDINEHKGWLNEYHLESINAANGKVQFRLHYDGVPVYDFNNLSIIEQVWREQELYQYKRSLLNIGHLLNKADMSIPTSEEIVYALENSEDYDVDKITDIQLGYYLNYIDEVHSLTLEPMWFMRYENAWIRIPTTETTTSQGEKGGN